MDYVDGEGSDGDSSEERTVDGEGSDGDLSEERAKTV